MMESPDLPSVLLAITTLITTFLTLQCFTPPNTLHVPGTKDRVSLFTSDSFLASRRLTVAIIGIYHAILMLNPTSPSPLLCPNPDNLNRSLFTWSAHSSTYLSLMLVAAPIRLLAFAQLGQNFTFQLAKPQSLVTSGMYRYVQHPSYTTNAVVVIANLLMFERPDGVVGCWMSEGVVRSRWWSVIGWCLTGFGVWMVKLRVTDEERMLKEAFGKEWVDWHRKTKRFVPGVF